MSDGIKILFSDGDKVFLELCKFHLRKSGLNIITCENGKDALEIIRNQKPNLVVMAAELPVMNGYDCCREVKMDETLQAIPVLLTLPYGKLEEVDRCLQAGSDEVLLKPINRYSIYSVISKFVALHRRTASRFQVRFPVVWTCGDGQWNSGYSINISIKGIFVESKVTATVNSIVSVNFTLPANDVELQCKARVSCVYHNDCALNSQSSEGLALVFVDLSEKNYLKISKYIRKEHIEPIMRRIT